MTKQPELFWGMIASMWIGNLMLIVINLPLVGVWVSLLRVPYRLLYPSIIVFCCIGSPPVQPEPLHAPWPSSDEPRVSR
jgi:putative tricarboxylic transport membrane protein